MKRDFIFTSESVTEGHPDKLCDQISDALIDAHLQQDPFSRVMAECAVATGVVFIASRFCSTAEIDTAMVARNIIRQSGYDSGSFNANDCTILTSLRALDGDRYHTLDERHLSETELDQFVARNPVTVFGFACDQTSALLPLPIWLAHRLARRLTAARLQRQLDYLSPDGTTQVAIEYRDYAPARIHSITLLTSVNAERHPAESRIRDDLITQVIAPVFGHEELRPDDNTLIFINPEGLLIDGGPTLHSGLTGRKNAIDTYGEFARHSGAALSGKDPLRIDRVGAYAARYAAKNIVAAGLARQCEVMLSYTVGQASPVSVQIESFGTGRVDDNLLAKHLCHLCDFRLGAILRRFNLRHLPNQVKGGFYRRLAAYGHVGRMDIGLPWEVTDLAAALAE